MGRRKVRIYYGMSGSLKGTTIGAKEKCSQIMWSGIKNWKTNRDLLFPWLSKETNLNYALLHLTRLSDYKVGNLDRDTNIAIYGREFVAVHFATRC